MEDRLTALLSVWHEQQRQGRDVPAAELCRDCPELAEEVGRRIEALRRMNDLMQLRNALAGPDAVNTCPNPGFSNFPTCPTNEVAGMVGTSGETTSAPPVASVPGYEILGELGRGGMGVVYKARHLQLNRIVALKMILAGGYAGASERARFLAEAEVVAGLQHPHIVALLEYGEQQGQPFFTLEFMPGGSLVEQLKGVPQPAMSAARLVEQLARAIHFAHVQGIVHRDLKPANVLLAEDGTPKISDFGLARRQAMGKGITGTGEVLGTPSYMAPEQAGGESKHAGPAADIYALGAILYECLTGRPPFRAATTVETVLQVMGQEPVSVRQLQPHTPVDLATICHKCLQKEPHQRYASAAELADDLRCWQAGQPVMARPVGRMQKSVKWMRRHPAAATAYGLLALVVVLGGLGGSAAWLWQSSEQAREQLAEEKRQTEIAHRDAETARARLVELTYLHRIALAHREWENAEIAHAEELLADCPPDKRGWEWRYVKRLCHADLRTLTGREGEIHHVTFSPDGRRLASAGGQGEIRIWDTDRGRTIFTCGAHRGAVSRLAFSPDGRCLLSAGFDQTARLWDMQNGAETARLPQGGIVQCVAFSPDGRFFATACREYTIKLWDARTRQEIRTFHGLAGQVESAAFSPNGLLLAACSWLERKWETKLWEVATGNEVLSLQNSDSVHDVVFSPNGKHLATATHDRSVQIWNTQTGQAVRTLFGHTASVRAVAYNREGTRLASASDDRTVRIWDAATGKRLIIYKGHKGSVVAVAFSPDGRRLASGSVDGTVKLWDAATDPRFAVLCGHDRSVSQVKVSPDGKTIASAGSDGTIRLWDIASCRQVHVLRVPSKYAESIAFSADGKHLAYGGETGRVQVWNAESGSETWALEGHSASVQCVAFNPDGTLLASASGKFVNQNMVPGEVKLWDARRGREIHTLKGNTQGFNCLAFSSDGQRLVCGGGRDLAVWDLSTGLQQFSRRAHDDSVVEVAFSPDGKRIASASFDKTVKVWQAASGEEQFTYRGLVARVTCVAFSADGRRIACGGDDGTVRIVVVESGEETLVLRAGTGPVHSVAFSPDGNLLVSGGWDNQIRVWDGRPLGKFHRQDNAEQQ